MMIWSRLRSLLTLACLVAAVCIVLFGERFGRSSAGIWGSLVRETMAVFRDPGTQWMVFLCAAIYFVTFTILEKRGKRNEEDETPNPKLETQNPKRCFNYQLSAINFHSPDLWLCGLLLIAGLAYAFNYEKASMSTQALVLLAGAAIGKGARLWVWWGATETQKAEKLKAESGNARAEHSTFNVQRSTSNERGFDPKPETWNLKRGTLLLVLLLLLAAAALWHPEGPMQYQYRGLNRWSGPWDNPNIFGMLMGTGVVIGAGLIVSGSKFQVSGSPVWSRWVWRVFLLIGMSCCGVGLLKSYSRGAWLGTVMGLGFLGYQIVRHRMAVPRLFNLPTLHLPIFVQRNWRPLALLGVSLLIIGFWQLRQTHFHPVRRVYSVGNPNDFSWRNRVAAWEGSLAMMADRPVTGFGWNRPEKIYDHFYRSPKVAEGMAIQLNHYFTLGMSLGLPALICFGMYVRLSLTRNAERGARHQPSTINHHQSTCRSAAVVLLIGLWFDGGLFNLATAAPLWGLLELGLVGRATPCAPPEETPTDGKLSIVT